MAGGSKKKKKPVANPARGFATTSIVSKTRADLSESTTPSNGTAAGTTPQTLTGTTTPDVKDTRKGELSGRVNGQANDATVDLKHLSPDELEARLEESELQHLVEQYAAKVRRDAARQVSRLKTDRRLLRPQAENVSTHSWLGDGAANGMQLVEGEITASLSEEADVVFKYSPEDSLLQQLWTLKLTLEGIQVAHSQITLALQHALSIRGNQDTNATAWGLTESLEWLASQPDENRLLQYDNTLVSEASVASDVDPGVLKRIQDAAKPAKPGSGSRRPLQKVHDAVRSSETTDSPVPDLLVSDTDSDLEPDEMLSRYVSYKLRLSEHNPDLYGDIASKAMPSRATLSGNGMRGREDRLLRRIKALENDPLFDQDAADLVLREKRASAFREQHERRKLGMPIDEAGKPDKPESSAAESASTAAEAMARDILETEVDSSDGLFEGMFDVPDTAASEQDRKPLEDPSGLETRDFGKVSGLSPRRILEESCRARDHGARVFLNMISPTTYHCRHSALVRWTKDHEPPQMPEVNGIDYYITPRDVLVEPVRLAAVGIDQSEGVACTAALFAIFSDSPKEDKSYLRLPQAFRDLYQEFAAAKQKKIDASDREVVKELRALVDAQRELYENRDVVFAKSFRDRSKRNTRENSPSGSMTMPIDQGIVDESLINFWRQRTAEPAYQKMLAVRNELPMAHFKEHALAAIRKSQVIILCGETGCGKSTQMPAFLLEDELSHGRPCRIYCTEPRRISAISLAQRVSEELGEGKHAVGTTRSLVGYSIRLESQTSAATRLTYATVGIVLRMLESNNALTDVTHLIIDEVHERSIDTDFLLIILLSLLKQRPDLKVVLMSATVDADRFSSYLNGAPIITVPGRTFPVRALYLEDAVEMTGYRVEDNKTRRDDDDDDEIDPDQLKASINAEDLAGYSKSTLKTLTSLDEYRMDYGLIIRLLEKVSKEATLKQFSKAVLVFLPGIAEIRQLTDMLTSHPSFAHGWLVYPLHSSFSSDEQQAAFQVPRNGLRKIVLATNIAETGITIPDVTCVIDTGKHKEMRFDERRQLSRLIQSFISRANAKQRRGRAGRVQEGICFHLFTKHRHDKMMAEQQTPEMLRLSLQDLVMRVKICKLGDVRSALAQALDPPSAKNIGRAVDALIEVGALTATEQLTALGQQLAKLPLDAQLGKLILLGSIFNCLDFALTTAAAASSKSPFLSPMNATRQADTVRLGFKRGDSDLLTTYNAYSTWRKVCNTAGASEFEFCKKNFLSPINLSNIEDLKGQLLSSLAEAGIVTLSRDDRASLSRIRHSRPQHRSFVSVPEDRTASDGNDALISAVVAWSFYPKLLRREGKGWRSVANNQTLSLHPTSVNKLSPSPSLDRTHYLSFYSIMQSSSSAARSTNARETTPVEPLALLLLAGDAKFDFYSGTVVIDGNRLRFKVATGRELLLLKWLRTKTRDMLAGQWKKPGRAMSERDRAWFDLLVGMFERFDESRKAREGK